MSNSLNVLYENLEYANTTPECAEEVGKVGKLIADVLRDLDAYLQGVKEPGLTAKMDALKATLKEQGK